MKTMVLLATGFCFALGSAASAAPCRDAKGKFITCPAPAAKKTCRDNKGKFIKCAATAPA